MRKTVYDLLIEHEKEKKVLDDLLAKTNTWLGRNEGIYDAIDHQQNKILQLENRFKNIRIYKFEISWGFCDGREGLYLADSVEDLHRKVDDDSTTNDDEKDMLKYGYFNEFKNKEIKTTEYTIDNAYSIQWLVN